jgi:hypothetical protein
VEELTLWQEDHPAKTSAWLESVQDWMDNGADCSGINAVSLIQSLPLGFCGKTSLALSPATTEPTLLPCCGESQAHSPSCPMGDGGLPESALDQSELQSGGCLTLNGSEWPSDGVACSLSAVLEANVDRRFYLSPRACYGILRRAEKRGRDLPISLEIALQQATRNYAMTAKTKNSNARTEP